MTFIELCEALAQITLRYPQQIDNDTNQNVIAGRPNTFAFMQYLEDIELDTINRWNIYTNKEYFYSRQWANIGNNTSQLKFDFPVLGLIAQRFTRDYNNTNGLSLGDNFTLYLFDQPNPSVTIEEHLQALIEIADNVFYYLRRASKDTNGFWNFDSSNSSAAPRITAVSMVPFYEMGKNKLIVLQCDFTIQLSKCSPVKLLTDAQLEAERNGGCCNA